MVERDLDVTSECQCLDNCEMFRYDSSKTLLKKRYKIEHEFRICHIFLFFLVKGVIC